MWRKVASETKKKVAKEKELAIQKANIGGM